ncbi:protein kinase domain-containing protein [Legionella maceachernii]|uniref:Bifunctional UGMP family protein/serine/threonine protein kinase n=2 Tax=Legionella TaxID=445 RepID=A0A0W0VWZ1_9GAMM|nr:hypothetical protein [Legionella maceachernii]KTD24182.1 bifunctional UGMP family protein/serine/threonine protein kinase [Legionella maceachernii]SJZ88550.1 O-antigen chain-terminating methyltransferase [Legionella maceachernii]SUO98803.1 serine/threonine protein kinase [Legionella maceachernii]
MDSDYFSGGAQRIAGMQDTQFNHPEGESLMEKAASGEHKSSTCSKHIESKKNFWSGLKKIAKHFIKRIAPPIMVGEVHRLRRIEQLLEQLNLRIENRLHHIEQLTQGIGHRLHTHDFRLDHLKELIKEVEPYQPTYGIGGVLQREPQRTSQDRCRAIETYFGRVAGKRMLDIGSSLGYMCYYFADRSAVTEGWEYNAKNAEVARLIGSINNIPTVIRTKALDENSINTIEPGQFDVVTILSVLHHTVYYNGLEYTQRLMKALLEKVPMLIVELARKNEDPTLFWNDAQPEDELAVFDLVKDKVAIEKIGDFSTHLSDKHRPLYVVKAKDNVITVNNRQFSYLFKTFEAYPNSPTVYAITRRYYLSKEYVIKEYVFDERSGEVNRCQIVSEINTLLHLTNIYHMPELVDFELSSSGAKLVLKRISGKLLVDLLHEPGEINAINVAQELLKSLADLEKEGLHHNDVRTWNVICDKSHVSLIDYGFVSHKEIDNDAISLLWLLSAILTGIREGYPVNKKELPKKAIFEQKPSLLAFYEAIESGVYSPSRLLTTIKQYEMEKK